MQERSLVNVHGVTHPAIVREVVVERAKSGAATVRVDVWRSNLTHPEHTQPRRCPEVERERAGDGCMTVRCDDIQVQVGQKSRTMLSQPLEVSPL